MNLSLTPLQIAAIVVAGAGATTDLRTGKIYNLLTFPAAAVGIVMHMILYGPLMFIWALAGWLVGAVIMTLIKLAGKPFWGNQALTFGDVKLIAAIGAFLGPGAVTLVIFYSCLCWGFPAIFLILKALPWKVIYAALASRQVKDPGKMLVSKEAREKGKRAMPVGPAIAAATIITCLLEKQTLAFLGFD